MASDPRWPDVLPPEVQAMTLRDKVLEWAMANHYDGHTISAAWYFSIPPTEVTPGQRAAQKTANYLFYYGNRTSIADILKDKFK